MRDILILIAITVIAISFSACGDDEMNSKSKDLISIPYQPIAYTVIIPENFPALEMPQDNPMTKEGVELGRRLFYDPIMSADSTISCASCHIPELAFTDGKKVSTGIEGQMGRRSSMSLVNIGFYYNGLFWDGRASTLEDQSLHPIEDPVEMGSDLDDIIYKLQEHQDYRERFRKSFGIEDRSEINRDYISKAISQFERIIIAGDSKYDRFARGEVVLSDLEDLGNSIFFDFDDGIKDGECNHCHSLPLFTSNTYHNNGLDSVGTDYTLFTDIGLGRNGMPGDTGKFRVTTLRNIEITGPYMHDGRFDSLDKVMNHYNSGVKAARNRDPLVEDLGLNEEQKESLIAFMKTLTDTSYLLIPEIHNPFK